MLKSPGCPKSMMKNQGEGHNFKNVRMGLEASRVL